MVDITDYFVEATESHTHIVEIDGQKNYVFIPSSSVLIEALDTASEDGIHLFEVIQEVTIPYIVYNGDPQKGAYYLQVIMKRLYNVYSPIAVLKNPMNEGSLYSDEYVICSPYARVNKEMLTEIIQTFEFLCKSKDIQFAPKVLRYMPLTWEVAAYKEGSDLDVAAAFDNAPSHLLSTMISSEPVSTRLKMSTAQAKRAVLVDSILMYSREEIKGDKIKARELIPLISIDRSVDMFYFLGMGRCLYRIFHGDSEGLDLWREATVPQKKDACDEYWATLDTTCTFYTVRTLQHWAQMDSPSQYKEWNSTSVRAAMEASVMATGGISDVANAAFRKNPTMFICDGDDVREAKFFFFNGTYYKECGSFKIQDYLDEEIIPEYETFLADLTKLVDSNSNEAFKDMMQKKIDKCIQIITKLKTPAFQKSVIEVLMRLYNKPGFDNIRDANPNLTVFEDCVFDAELKTIRQGMPEDNTTASTGYEFRAAFEEYHWDHPDVQTVLRELGKIIYDQGKQELMRREFASRLHASNPLKRGLFVYGPTNNAKSAVYAWLAMAVGPTYFPDVPNNLLYTEEAHPGNASPQMEMLRFARVLPQMEITDLHVLNEGLFKRFTGCVDKITYRGLYQKKIKSFVPRCVPHTVCNTFPRMNGNSAAMRTRAIVLHLDSKFITEKDPEFEIIKDKSEEEREAYMAAHHWYWANLQFEENVIHKTYKAFMWVMIQDYIKYSKGETVQMKKLPENVLRDTVEYFARSNIYMKFIKQATKKEEGAPGVTTFALYNSYKKWYMDNVSRFGYVQLDKFVEELSHMSIRAHNDIYSNIVLTYQ